MQRIHFAVINRNLEEVKSLIEAGASVNALGSGDITPPMLAIKFGDHRIFQYLLEHGADIYFITQTNWSCLTFAARFNNVPLTKFLLKLGMFNIELRDCNGFTPLAHASSQGHVEIVELLLANGSNPNFKNNNGDTALTTAIEIKNIETVKALLDSNDIDIELGDQYGLTPLTIAATNEMAEIVELLINKGANVATALMQCCHIDFDKAVTLIEETDTKIKEQIRINNLVGTIRSLRGDASSYFFRLPGDVIEYLVIPMATNTHNTKL